MSSIKELTTYTVTSPLIQLGEFTDSKGEKLNVTESVLKDIYNSISTAAPCPMKDSHDNDHDIGDIKKYELKSDGIYQKTLITDTQRFENRFKNGHFFVSPELEVESSNGKVTNARLLGAALTNNPGMIKTKPEISVHHFEGPATPESNTTSQGNVGSNGWQEPLGELKSTINTLNNTLSTFGEQVKNMNSTTTTSTQSAPTVNTTTEQPQTVTMGADDLAKLVSDAVEKRMAEMSKQNQPTTQTTPEASEATVPKTPSVDDSEIAKKYAEMMNELESLKGTQEKAFKKQLNGILGELKSMGMDNPEKMVPDGLTTEQKITILESIKENFAKNSPMSAPLQDPLANVSNGSSKKGLTVDDVLNDLEAGSDPAMRNKLMMLSDSNLMAKYNMNALFDSNGTYIGPM